MELWRYYRILRRRRWLILFCVAVCVGVVAVHVVMTPMRWVGRTTVMERQPTEKGVPVFPQPYMMQADVQMHLADLAHIATSNSVVNRTAESLAEMMMVVDPEKLIRTLRVRPEADTQLLAIEVTDEDRDVAQSAANVVAAEFQRFYRELVSGAAEQSREFIEMQLKDAKAKLAQARAARRDFKTENDLVELGAQAKILVERAAQIDTEAIHAQVAADQMAGTLRMLEEQIKAEPEMKLASESVANNPIYQELLAKKVSIEADLGGMMGGSGPRRGENHPDVQRLRKQLEEIDAQIRKQAPMIVNQTSDARNTVYTEALTRRLVTDAEAAGTASRRDALLAALDQERERLRVLPEQEMKMAQLELDVTSAEETYRLLRAKLEEARIKASETSKASAIQVIDPAYAFPEDPSNRKKALKVVLAFLLSPLLGAGLAFLLNYLDNTVKTPAEAEDLLGLPVVTIVPLARSHALARRPNNEPLIATYEMLTAMLWRSVAKSEVPAVLVASAEPDTGRSTTAANLAITLARDGAKVILVDADMRKPNLHLMFNVRSKPGLSNVLSGGVGIEDAVVPTKVEGLLLLPAGPAPDNPVRLLRSEQMAEFVRQVGGLADFVVFDSPAGITFADASLLASHIRNVVIVHGAGKVARGAESEFRGKLDLVGANLLGVVLNRVRPEDSHGYFHYRRFYADVTVAERVPAVAGQVRAIPPGDADRDAGEQDQ